MAKNDAQTSSQTDLPTPVGAPERSEHFGKSHF